MERTVFSAGTPSGDLVGWVTGQGRRVVALHGGPGLGYEYLDVAVDELASRYQVATFQQRGLAPSTEEGEFSVAEAVADIAAVLDTLGWETAYLMGHSWGGHLAFHAAVAIPGRLAGVLSVDPLGAVGDGGSERFGAELIARMPESDRERAQMLNEKDGAGDPTAEEALAAMSLCWPSYFADPASAPAMPSVKLCQPASTALWADLTARLPELEASLPTIRVPFGVVVGELSPMPASAGIETAGRIPGAWAHVVPGAGHFVWHEAPGCLLSAMDRLVGESEASAQRSPIPPRAGG